MGLRAVAILAVLLAVVVVGGVSYVIVRERADVPGSCMNPPACTTNAYP